MSRLFLLLALILLAACPDGPPVQAAVAQPKAAAAAETQSAHQFPVCGADPEVAALLGEASFAAWSGWVRGLSGDADVQVGGQTRRITSRHSASLFNGTSPAYDYVREQVAAWYPQSQIEEDEFIYSLTGQTWKNLILTIPGDGAAWEVVILSAHLDAVSGSPGADDNATGSAALLEAARLLRPQDGQPRRLSRTLRLIWFTGEEQFMVGSTAYAGDHDLGRAVGAINLDMIGYDGDGDRCFEVHVGIMPESQPVGQCLLTALDVYAIDLNAEYLTTTATNRSDHSAFWNAGVGAIGLAENFFTGAQGSACSAQDRNPYYHTSQDTYANMHPEYGFAVARAGIAAAFGLANAVEGYRFWLPVIGN